MKNYKYVRATAENEKTLSRYPNAGPRPNIAGMRRLYWGNGAYIIKCGQYAYNVPSEIFYSL